MNRLRNSVSNRGFHVDPSSAIHKEERRLKMFRFRCVAGFLAAMIIIGTGSPGFGELSPEFQLGARGVMSLNFDDTSEGSSSQINDFSDSSLTVGFRQKLYNRYRGQLVIGFQFPDADSDLGQLYFHQVFIKIEDRTNILKIGRSRVRSALIEFPTLRDDDALHFTDVLNPFSSGENTEESQYGDVFEVARIFGQRYWLRVHSEHFTKTPAPGTQETDFDMNALGVSFEYRVPESQRWNREVLNQAGIGFNSFRDVSRTGGGDGTLKNIIFSAVLNVRPDPVHFWDLRHQTIYNLGFDDVKRVADFGDMTRAKSVSAFTSLRYLYRKLERPAAQLSASYGYKTFPDLTKDTSQQQYVVNGFYRLGSNFDAGLQLQHLRFHGDLKDLFGGNETRVQFALIFSVDQSWNRQFDDRDSLLNLEHGYIP